MNIRNLFDWKRHPYTDSLLLIVVILIGGGSVRFWVRPTVQLSVDGATHKLHPMGKTVSDVLVQEKITLGPEDLCSPPPPALLERNTIVQIIRVTHTTEIRTDKLRPRIYSRTQLKANLRPVLVERGTTTEKIKTVRTTFHDGVFVSEKVLKQKTILHPIFTLTLFNRTNRQPAKVYDLMKAKRLEMRATGYYVGERTVPSDETRLGYKLRRGLVAVDPKVIPLRTRLYVKGYGYAYAADTGSAIKGNRIDLAVKDRKEEAKFNRQKMTVFILEKAKKW